MRSTARLQPRDRRRRRAAGPVIVIKGPVGGARGRHSSSEAAQLLHEQPEGDVADDGEGRVGRSHAALVVVADEGAQPEVDDLATDRQRRGQRRGDALRIEVEQDRRQERAYSASLSWADQTRW